MSAYKPQCFSFKVFQTFNEILSSEMIWKGHSCSRKVCQESSES